MHRHTHTGLNCCLPVVKHTGPGIPPEKCEYKHSPTEDAIRSRGCYSFWMSSQMCVKHRHLHIIISLSLVGLLHLFLCLLISPRQGHKRDMEAAPLIHSLTSLELLKNDFRLYLHLLRVSDQPAGATGRAWTGQWQIYWLGLMTPGYTSSPSLSPPPLQAHIEIQCMCIPEPASHFILCER